MQLYTSNASYRYPEDIAKKDSSIPWVLFEVLQSRHVGRNQILGAENAKDQSGDTVASCVLYLSPEALKSSQDITWDGEEYGIALGRALESGLQGGKIQNLITNLAGTGVTPQIVGNSLAGIEGLVEGVAFQGLTQGSFRSIVDQVIQTSTGITAEQTNATAAGAFGQRINPRLDLLYQSVTFREHEMSFKLIPRNEKEAQQIDNILNVFSYYSLPSFGDPSTAFFIGFPYEFKITMFSQNSGNGERVRHHINTIERSVLTHIDINHAAADRTSFIRDRDGEYPNDYYPTATILNLSFKEVRLPGRDPRPEIYGGGNVVLRGDVNSEGYPTYTKNNGITQDPRETSNITRAAEIENNINQQMSSGISGTPKQSTDPTLVNVNQSTDPTIDPTINTPNPVTNPKRKVLTGYTRDTIPQWLNTTQRQIDFQIQKNKGSLYGNRNPKLVDAQTASVGDYAIGWTDGSK